MNGRRLARLAWVVICNAFLFWSAARVIFPPEDAVFTALGVVVCVASGVGIALEAMKHRLAAAVNIGTSALVTVFLATAILRLPALAAHEASGSVGEAAEGAGFLLIFSLIPLCLTLVTGLLYRVVDIEPERSSIRLGL